MRAPTRWRWSPAGWVRRHRWWVAAGLSWLLVVAALVVLAGALLGGWGPEPHTAADILFAVAAVMVTVLFIPLVGLLCMASIAFWWLGLVLSLKLLELIWLALARLGSRPSDGPAGARAATAAPRGGPDPRGYYTALGVEPRSPEGILRVAYRRQALRNHPDRGGSVRRMQAINEAWAVLGDTDRRRAYDAGAGAV